MSKQYFELSTDYDLADKLLRERQTLAVYLTDDGLTLLHRVRWENNSLIVDGLYASKFSRSYYEDYNAQFLLPVDLPNTTELQHSLSQALNEADELREKCKDLQSEVNGLKCNNFIDRNQAQSYEAIIKKTQEALKDSFDKNDVLESENEINDQVLTFIAKQLGFDHFEDEQVILAIEELQQQTTDSKKTLQYSKDRIDELLNINAKLESDLIESENWIKDWKAKCETAENTIAILQDNLTRSQSDRLSELTTIMRMLQALSDTPQDCHYGAIRLIHQVIYDQIGKLEPTQSLDI